MKPENEKNGCKDALECLRTTISEWIELPDPSWDRFASIFKPHSFDRSQHVLLPGSRQHRLIFVAEGLLRVYTVGNSGRESNKGFMMEGVLAGPVAACMLGLPSLYGVKTVEPSRVLLARYEDLFGLYEKDPIFDRLGRRYMEWLVVQKELRERISFHDTVRERYEAFLKYYPQLARRLPQIHIASLLGTTPETLSRARKN